MRERQVLDLIMAGKSTKQLAAELGISFKTAACHRYRIISKLEAVNTADLISRAVRFGVVALPSDDGQGPKAEPGETVSSSATRIYRERLSAELAKSVLLQEQCRRSREEFAAVREEFLRNCHGFLRSARSLRDGRS